MQHCWVICTRTKNPDANNSLKYAPVFAEFINKEIAPNLQVHYGEEYSVLMEDNANICTNTYYLIKDVYHQARKIGLKANEIITDITGSIRAVTIGAILASFHKDEDIEYVEANYDPKGEPTGPSFPLLVKYKPELVSF